MLLNLASGTVLLVVSSVLAFLEKPKEMGLAILAGAIGLAFSNIDKIKKFKGGGFEAEMKEKLQAVVDKETEPEPERVKTKDVRLIDGGKRAVLTALGNPKYTWRFIGGLAEETKLDKEIVRAALSEMEHMGVVQCSTGKSGPIWSLTPLGRETLAVLQNQDSNA